MSVYEEASFSILKGEFFSAFNKNELKKHPNARKNPDYENAYLQYYNCPACKEGHGIGAYVFFKKDGTVSVMSFNNGNVGFIVYKIALTFPSCKILYTIETDLIFAGEGKEYIHPVR